MTHRFLNFQLLREAIPFILANASIPLLGIMNIAIAGHLQSGDYLASLSIGTMIVGIIYWWLNSLRMGTTGLVAQAHAKQDHHRINHILRHSVLLAIGISLLTAICHTPLLKLAFWVTQPSPSLQPLITTYFNIRLIGMLAVLLNYIIIGCLIGFKQGRCALWSTLTTLFVSTLSGCALVYGLHWHNSGIAIADVMGQVAGVVVGLHRLNRHHPVKDFLHIPTLFNRIDPPLILELITMQRDLFLRTVALSFGFGFFTVASTAMGAETLAANTVLLNLTFLSAYFLDGFANVAEGHIGFSLGQGDRIKTLNLMRETGVWIGIFAAAIAALYLCAGKYAIHCLTSIHAIQTLAGQYLIYAAALPCVAALSYWLDAIYIAALQQRPLRNSAIIAFAVLLLLHAFSDTTSNAALWSAFLCFFLSRGVYQLIWLKGCINHSLQKNLQLQKITSQADYQGQTAKIITQ